MVRSDDGILGTPSCQALSWVIVLTAAISPSEDVTHTQRLTPFLRERDYVRSLNRWAGGRIWHDCKNNTNTDAGGESESNLPWPLVLVESSNANLTALRRAVVGGAAEGNHIKTATTSSQPQKRRNYSSEWNAGPREGSCSAHRDVEFLSTSHGQKVSGGDARRGKGIAEYRAIRFALEHSEIIRRYRPSHIAKVTGRYFVRNLDEELHRVAHATCSNSAKKGNEGPRLVVQSAQSPWTLWDGVIRSEVIGWEIGLEDWLFGSQDEAVGRPMERILFERARSLKFTNGTVAKFRALEIDPARNGEGTCVRCL